MQSAASLIRQEAHFEYQVKYVTLYSFSTENWNRLSDEVNGLLRILEESIDNEALELHQRGIKLCHLGQLERLAPELQ